MKKIIYILSFAASLSTFSCRYEVNESRSFPNVATYSPGVAVSGDTVTILGSTLDGAKVKVGDQTVELVDQTDEVLSFVVDSSLFPLSKDGFYDLTVDFEDAEDFTFSMPIVLNYEVQPEDLSEGGWLEDVDDVVDGEVLPTGPAQLLITDFDGGGIRFSDETTLFDRTRLENQVQPTGISDIVSSSSLTIQNPLGNNFYRLIVEDLSQLGGSGHAGEVWSSSDVLNDGISQFPQGFINYPNGPLVEVDSDSDLRSFYINFLLFKNNSEKTVVYPYLYNDNLDGANQFRSNYDFSTVDNVKVSRQIAVGEWVWQSVAVRNYVQNFGFGGSNAETGESYSRITPELINTINKVKFGFAHEDKLDNQDGVPEGDVQIYLDHIIITQGAPFYGHKR